MVMFLLPTAYAVAALARRAWARPTVEDLRIARAHAINDAWKGFD